MKPDNKGLQIRSSAWLEHYTDNVGVSSSNLLRTTIILGGLAQLARAPALHAGGQRFDSVILHQAKAQGLKPKAESW